MRERFFSVFGPAIVDAAVLDLFAGTGAVGLEALSRGAATVVFVESHHSVEKLIRANLESLGVGNERGSVMNRPASRAVTELARNHRSFDLVWADPPFETWTDGLDALTAVVEAGMTSTNAVLCLECPTEADVETVLPATLGIERDLKGGASRVVILRRI